MSSSSSADAMEVEMPVSPSDSQQQQQQQQPTTTSDDMAVLEVENEEEEEEDVSDWLDFLDTVASLPPGAADQKLPVLAMITSDHTRWGAKATALKERAMYETARAYCHAQHYNLVASVLIGPAAAEFFNHVTKAKAAKVVRQVLDIVCSLAPLQLEMQAAICRSIIDWTQREKRTFLRQRVEAKLSSILFEQGKFGEALELIDRLLYELKKLDDKQLLVETHLMESKIHFGLQNVPKAKAALTASRTCANAIYVSPTLQASIDSMSGTIHTEEGDYDTAHSYFLEAFEQLDQMNAKEQAIPCLKYMMLCRILDSLQHALHISSKGAVGAKADRSEVDISGMISGRQGVKYAGRDIEAMAAIAKAASQRSLKQFQEVLQTFRHELQDDLLINHHLSVLQEQLLESNLIRIIEPYSCVELTHVASLMEMDLAVVEKKLSQMILDGKFQGILDQGHGQLIVYEETPADVALQQGLDVIANMDAVVTSLFERAKALRTLML